MIFILLLGGLMLLLALPFVVAGALVYYLAKAFLWGCERWRHGAR